MDFWFTIWASGVCERLLLHAGFEVGGKQEVFHIFNFRNN